MVRRWFYGLVISAHKALLLAGVIVFGCGGLANAASYVPSASHRVDLPLNDGWRFLRQDATNAETIAFDDSTWTSLSLPHTWNNLDGQDGGNDYYRGTGWYRTHYSVDPQYAGRHFFLKFDGAFLVTDVYVNGSYVGEHKGGFADFVFDVTPLLKVGADNLIAVKVNNATNADVPPLSADFTFFGGLYRGVHLLVTDPVQISPLDFGSPGVYLKTTEVSADSAKLGVITVLSNSTAASRSVTLRAVVTDAGSNIVADLTKKVRLKPGPLDRVTMSTKIEHPHLWDGRADPYLYQVHVEVVVDGEVADAVTQPLGFRSFYVDPDKGFFLNGYYLDLHGVSMHQDWINHGWAIGQEERQANFKLIMDIGATALRLSHYEHHDETYQLADQDGIILWSEIPLVNRINESPAFYANAKQQLTELIRQRYNHPAVVCWGIFNEVTLRSGPPAVRLAKELARLEAQEDPTRPSTSAANSSDTEPSSWCSELNSFNKYFGWYDGKLADFGPWADHIHRQFPNRCIGISEFGAGANIRQHEEVVQKQPVPTGKFHPEEYQNLYHESHWQQMKSRPYLWCKFVWNLCDFAVDYRKEGEAPGRNDKGLVTYDRQIRKDAFYWYQANWTTSPMVYITGHTFPDHTTNAITAKVYANCDTVELFLNGMSQGLRTSTNCICTWPVTLAGGANAVRAVGLKGGVTVEDSLTWTYAPPADPAHAARDALKNH